MASKTIYRRAAADRDVEGIIDYYLAEADVSVAMAFIDELEQAYRHLAVHPGTGSPRLGHELGIEGLRSWPLRRFPHVVFYFERPDHVDIWRVLHGQRDIPAWLD